uniref:Uncharacterized protein n=1 Tax=Knipowitschia caucasica TaxID=637954 RepID=A0AAV2KLA5_KNICA
MDGSGPNASGEMLGHYTEGDWCGGGGGDTGGDTGGRYWGKPRATAEVLSAWKLGGGIGRIGSERGVDETQRREREGGEGGERRMERGGEVGWLIQQSATLTSVTSASEAKASVHLSQNQNQDPKDPPEPKTWVLPALSQTVTQRRSCFSGFCPGSRPFCPGSRPFCPGSRPFPRRSLQQPPKQQTDFTESFQAS